MLFDNFLKILNAEITFLAFCKTIKIYRPTRIILAVKIYDPENRKKVLLKCCNFNKIKNFATNPTNPPNTRVSRLFACNLKKPKSSCLLPNSTNDFVICMIQLNRIEKPTNSPEIH